MSWLRNCWYAAAWSDDLARGERLGRTITDTPILFWRDTAGRARALDDRCAHRLAPLSLGDIRENIVRCKYHGLAYDGDTGRCVSNPHGPILEMLTVRVFPLAERHKLIWVWLGDPAKADEGAIPDLGFVDHAPERAFSKGYLPTAADHRLLEDNILDLSHGDYLHAETLGGGAITRAKVTVEERGDDVFVRWAAKDEIVLPIWKGEMPTPDSRMNMTIEVLWRPSGVMSLYSGTAPTGTEPEDGFLNWAAHIMTPATAFSTHYLYCNTRNYRADDVDYNEALAAGLAQAFGGEDKPMIEGQQSRIGEADLFDRRPTLLPIDNASTRARRIYKRLIEAEQAGI